MTSDSRLNVYIAAKFAARSEVRGIASAHRDWMFCTSRWALEPGWEDQGVDEEDHAYKMAEGDLEDVANSDVVLVIATRDGWGHAVELGYALGHGIPVVVVDGGDGFFSVFHYAGGVIRYEKLDDAIKHLQDRREFPDL